MRSYRFVFSPKWLAFHALTWLVLIPAFIGLGQWQRNLWRDHARSQGAVLAALAARPVPLDSKDPAGHTVARSQQWTMVSATGRYDTAHQFMARNRSQDQQPGWFVVTPLLLPDGTAVLVNQGWVRESNTGNASAAPSFPPVPSGTVTVSGSLQPDETTADTRIKDDTAQLAANEIALITRGDLAARVPYRLRDGSIRLTSSLPANTAPSAAEPVPNPTYENAMYIAYMVQWWVFAAVMPVTWFLLIRREAGDRRLAARQAAADGGEPARDGERLPADTTDTAEPADRADRADDRAEPAGPPSAGARQPVVAGALADAQPVEQGGEAVAGEKVQGLPHAVGG
ncbi:SURF1 family protein [Actinocrinis puniceicyclus]|uniref:SURF1-like protein n=1 Tax=Actinocrinis puniceicyclus TaxID=977794 RepID=A0A8J8BB00_9ACTN|nr:SURF1 family protein [Actinocrinis puniceicyclus]MBS2961596.1 SURF1 family protein [Actinocrinis puniceicyclus]